jgi:E3 ubiquitin-protein ligase DOA10
MIIITSSNMSRIKQLLKKKVCLCSEETDEDPLISPCQCKGSLKKIHVGCLRTWINSRVKKDINDIATSYNFTKFECEICKYPFPKIVKMNSKEIEMMTINKPNKPYIILESLNKVGDQLSK